MNSPGVGFIGAGKLATGLALALDSCGYRVTAVASRSLDSARRLSARLPSCYPAASPGEVAQDCDLVFITTPDDAIASVCSSLEWRPGQGVVHCSGALPLEVLSKAASDGASTGSFHPFQTLACLETPQEAVGRLSGITYAVEGHGWVVGFLQEAASRLGGRVARISPQDRTLYHASAVLACGCVTALLKAASDLWLEMGYSMEEAQAALAPLAGATAANFGRTGPQEGMTGPVARGDVATVARHLEELERRVPRLVPLACLLGLESLSILPQGNGPEEGQALRELFAGYLRNSLDEILGAGTIAR